MLFLACGAIDELTKDVSQASAWLSDGERQHCDRLGEARRLPFVAARRLLRDLISQQGVVDAEERVSISAGGAPELIGHPEIYLSLSHRAGWVTAAISDGPVGIDIEVVKPREALAMADQICSGREAEILRTLPAAEALQRLHEVWALKEAAFKSGLSKCGPMEFHRVGFVTEETEQCHAMSWKWQDGRVMACVATDFRELRFPTIWPGAVCVQGWAIEEGRE